MSARCAVCKKAIVSQKGQLCVACQMAKKTAVRNVEDDGEEHLPEKELYEVNQNDIHRTDKPDTSGLQTEQERYYKGTVHNFHQTENQRSTVWKIWNSLVRGVPLSFSNVQYEFTLYEGETGNVRGRKVVVYGDAGYSMLSDGSIVSVRGKTDRNGAIVASEAMEISTGFRLRPKNAIPALAVQGGVIVLSFLVFGGLIALGGSSKQVAETVGMTGDVTQEAVETCRISLLNVLLAVIAGLGAVLFLKSHVRKKTMFALLCALFAAGMFSQMFLILFVLLLLCMVFMGVKTKK